MMFRLREFVFCTLVCTGIDAARILAVFPTPSISHQVVFRPLTQELSRRGHDVVVITPDPAFPKGQTPANLTEIDVHDVSYKIWREAMAKVNNGDNHFASDVFESFVIAFIKIFGAQTSVPEVLDIIENKRDTFDLLLVETCFRQALAFSHIIKVPVISVSSLGAMFHSLYVMGAPTHPLLYPEVLATRIYNLTLREKIDLYYKTYIQQSDMSLFDAKENANIKKIFGADVPDLSELNKNIAMLFLNIHPIWEGNRPVPPSVVHIGGIHQRPQKELPQDLKQYLDSSKHGVIYLSFGSNVDTSTLPADKIQAIINVFSQLPYNVLWKWNQDELPGRTENIKISKWLPQSDLLNVRKKSYVIDPVDSMKKTHSTRKYWITDETWDIIEKKKGVQMRCCFRTYQAGHPKIKLFVTQGGLQSTDETIIAGVPVVGIPMLGDQWYNVQKYGHHGIGKQVNLVDLNEETLMSAIKTVIEDKSYRENVVRLRVLMYDQPQTPLDRAVWWVEHVLRHGGAHLRAPAANMDWVEYYEVKLVLLVLSVAITAVALVSLVLWKVVKCVLGSSSSKVKLS